MYQKPFVDGFGVEVVEIVEAVEVAEVAGAVEIVGTGTESITVVSWLAAAGAAVASCIAGDHKTRHAQARSGLTESQHGVSAVAGSD